MNEALIANHNERVHPEDIVYVHGDVALGKIDETLPIVAQLNGKKLLIPGNHDRCWSGNKKVQEVDRTRYIDVGFTILPENVVLAMERPWRLCHFPYDDGPHGDKYIEHLPTKKFDDEILIHGHVHNAWKVKDNQINVGVDVWDYRPVHIDEIHDLIGQ